MNIWVCEFCDYIYDEAKGVPKEGIPAGTCWEDVPFNWNCPYCAAKKFAFKLIEQNQNRVNAVSMSILNP